MMDHSGLKVDLGVGLKVNLGVGLKVKLGSSTSGGIRFRSRDCSPQTPKP